MGTFGGARKHKVGRWLAVERHRRRIVAGVPGNRSAATARRLWAQLPAHWRGPRCRYFPDLGESYVGVLPRWQHRRCPKGSGGAASIVEAINCALRQRCGVLVRKSCSFSKCIRMHFARIKFVIEHHNLNIIPQ